MNGHHGRGLPGGYPPPLYGTPMPYDRDHRDHFEREMYDRVSGVGGGGGGGGGGGRGSAGVWWSSSTNTVC